MDDEEDNRKAKKDSPDIYILSRGHRVCRRYHPLSLTQHTMQGKNIKMKKESDKIGLKINQKRFMILRMKNKNTNKVCVDGYDLETVDTFCYHRRFVNVIGEVKEEVNIGIGEALTAFRNLGSIWKSRKI
jgi:hypothetical protein